VQLHLDDRSFALRAAQHRGPDALEPFARADQRAVAACNRCQSVHAPADRAHADVAFTAPTWTDHDAEVDSPVIGRRQRVVVQHAHEQG
jgi:hypothetical protein